MAIPSTSAKSFSDLIFKQNGIHDLFASASASDLAAGSASSSLANLAALSMDRKLACPHCDDFSAPSQAILNLHVVSNHPHEAQLKSDGGGEDAGERSGGDSGRPLLKFKKIESLLSLNAKPHSSSSSSSSSSNQDNGGPVGSGFPCGECGKMFETVNKRNRHFKNVHGEKNFVCPHCPYRTGRKDNYVVHVRKQHEDKELVIPAMPATSPGGHLNGATSSRYGERESPSSPAPAIPGGAANPFFPLGMLPGFNPLEQKPLFPQLLPPQAMLLQQLRLLQAVQKLQEAAGLQTQFGKGSPGVLNEDEQSRASNASSPSLAPEVDDFKSGSDSPGRPDYEMEVTEVRKRPRLESNGDGAKMPGLLSLLLTKGGSELSDSASQTKNGSTKEGRGPSTRNESPARTTNCDEQDKEFDLWGRVASLGKKHECNFCDFSSRSVEDVRGHEKAVHQSEMLLKREKSSQQARENGVVYSCKICDHKTQSKQASIDHVKLLHERERNQKEFACQTCDFVTLHQSLIQTHVQTVHKRPGDLDDEEDDPEEEVATKEFQCKVCHRFKGQDKAEVLAHINAEHLDKECSKCAFRAEGVEEIRRHFEEKHSDDSFEEERGKAEHFLLEMTIARDFSAESGYDTKILEPLDPLQLVSQVQKEETLPISPVAVRKPNSIFSQFGDGLVSSMFDIGALSGFPTGAIGKFPFPPTSFLEQTLLASNGNLPPAATAAAVGKAKISPTPEENEEPTPEEEERYRVPGGDGYACNQCHYTSRKFYVLKNHVMSVHMKRKVHQCPHCNKLFGSVSNLSRHKKMHITDVSKMHRCPHCDFVTKWPDNVRQHVRAVHLNIKSHRCRTCAKKFSDRSSLNRHIKSFHDQSHPL